MIQPSTPRILMMAIAAWIRGVAEHLKSGVQEAVTIRHVRQTDASDNARRFYVDGPSS